jgi:hypothetical protein
VRVSASGAGGLTRAACAYAPQALLGGPRRAVGFDDLAVAVVVNGAVASGFPRNLTYSWRCRCVRPPPVAVRS